MTTKPIIILLRGYAQVGKDSTADELLDQINRTPGYIAIKISIAYYLKYMYARDNQLDLDRLLFDRDYKEKYRPDLIKKGYLMRKTEPHSLVSKIHNAVVNTDTPKNTQLVVIVPDWRYNNEYDFFVEDCNDFYSKALKFYVYVNDKAFMERHGEEYFIHWSKLHYDVSEREIGLERYVYDMVIDNSGSKDVLADYASIIIKNFILNKEVEKGAKK